MNDGTMHGNTVLGPINDKELSGEYRNKALEAVNLINEKRRGNIKERTCANGSGQKRYLKEYESVYSPEFSTESLMSTILLDDMKKHDVEVFDVPGSYLRTNISANKQILLRIRYEFVGIMCEVNPDYKPYVKY